MRCGSHFTSRRPMERFRSVEFIPTRVRGAHGVLEELRERQVLPGLPGVAEMPEHLELMGAHALGGAAGRIAHDGPRRGGGEDSPWG